MHFTLQAVRFALQAVAVSEKLLASGFRLQAACHRGVFLITNSKYPVNYSTNQLINPARTYPFGTGGQSTNQPSP